MNNNIIKKREFKKGGKIPSLFPTTTTILRVAEFFFISVFTMKILT